MSRLALYRAGESDREIARREGVHPETIREWRRRRGLPPNSRRNEPKGDLDRRMALYRDGLDDAEIARREGVRRCTIFKWRGRRGLPPNRVGGRSVQASCSIDAQFSRSWHDPSWTGWLDAMGATCSIPPAMAA